MISSQKIVNLGSLVRLDQGLVLPMLENSEFKVSSSNPNTSRKSNVFSTNRPESIEANSVMSRIESLCQIVHETDSVTSVTFLETLVQRFKTFHSNYLLHVPSRTLEVVVKENEHFQGQIPSIMGGDNHFHNRCFEHGVRGFIEKKLSGEVVKEQNIFSYQSPGN